MLASPRQYGPRRQSSEIVTALLQECAESNPERVAADDRRLGCRVNTEEPTRVMTGRVLATWFGPSKTAEKVAVVTGHADPNNWIREKVQAILQESTTS